MPSNQVVVAPGELINHQVIGHRHRYEYSTTTPSHWKPAIVSAKYQTHQAKWISPKTAQEVSIDLFYVNADEIIINTMLQRAMHALEQAEAVFGAYPLTA